MDYYYRIHQESKAEICWKVLNSNKIPRVARKLMKNKLAKSGVINHGLIPRLRVTSRIKHFKMSRDFHLSFRKTWLKGAKNSLATRNADRNIGGKLSLNLSVQGSNVRLWFLTPA